MLTRDSGLFDIGARLKKSTKGKDIKLKLRGKRFLYTLKLKDSDKADKIKQSLPPSKSLLVLFAHESLFFFFTSCDWTVILGCGWRREGHSKGRDKVEKSLRVHTHIYMARSTEERRRMISGLPLLFLLLSTSQSSPTGHGDLTRLTLSFTSTALPFQEISLKSKKAKKA